MNVFRTDTLRLIKKTSNRFLSLVLIVLIGSGFMMGLMSCTAIMKRSVDYYNDEYNLQDVQIYSSYGFCEEDIEAIKDTEGVKDVFASKFVDAYVKDESTEKEYVARIEEINRDVNKFELVEGEMPKHQDECLVLITSTNADLSTTYNLGDKIKVYREDEDITDYIRHEEYKIVGFVKSPAYTSKLLGTSTYNNLDLNAAVYIFNSNFIKDYYTTVYLTLDGTIDELSYTNAYQNKVDDLISNVEDTAFSQQDYYRNETISKAQKELDENKQKFEEEKADGQKQLDDAKKQLDDAHIQIVSYEAQAKTINTLVSSVEKEIKNYEALLKTKQDELGISTEDIDNALNNVKTSDIFKALVEYGKLNDYINDSWSVDDLASIQELLNDAKATLNKYKSQISSLNSQIASGKAQYESGLEEYNEALVTFNEEIEKAEAELTKAQQTIDELPEASWTVLDRSGHYSSYMFDATCKQMSAIGYSFPMLFYLVAALVCMTTMTRLVDEQRGQIGIYRALGFSKKQVIGKYVSYAFLASIVGSIFGIIIGQLIFPIVIYDAWGLMYAMPEYRLSYPLIYVVICVLAFSLLMMGVTYLVVRKSMEEVPAQLMRPKAPKTAKATFIEKIPFIWDKLSFTSKITARNLIRYKARFFMTVIGVAGCTGLLIVGWGVKDSVSDVVELQYGKIFNYDYQITLENDHNIDSNISILKKDSNNDVVVPFMTYSSSVTTTDDEEGTVIVEVVDAGDALDMLDLSYAKSGDTLNIRNNGVIVSEKFAKNNNIKEGDIITIESLNGVKAEVKVSAICEWYFQHYIFMSNDYYETIFEETVHNTSIAIKSDNKDTLLKDIEKLEDYSTLSDFSSMIDQFETMIKALDFIVAVIILAAGSLALVVLINLTQVNVSERIREIATLKVLGFRVKEVDSYIFKEIFILTIIGGLVGLPLGTLEHHFVMNVINMEMIMFGMNISVFSYAISFTITIIFTIIVLLLTRKSLRQIQMVESLKSVE